MATISPLGVYSGGAVKLDSSPQTNFLIQALAKKQAQQDALNQYYRNVQERLSEKEMRPQDAQGFQNKYNDFQNYYLQNKKAILGGNIQANNEYNQRYRDLISDANKSKDAAKDELLAAQHKFSGKWNPTSGDMDVMQKMGASIYDPQHYKDNTMTDTYGVNDLSVNVPDLDEKKYLQTITYGQKPHETPSGDPVHITDPTDPQNNWRMRQNYDVSYTPDQLKAFGNQAMVDATTNRSVNKHATTMHDYLDFNPTMKDALNSTYKQYYGKDAETPADFYAAQVIQNLGVKSQGTPKEYTDEYAKAKYTQGQINARQDKTIAAQGNQFIDTYDHVDKALQANETKGINWLPVSNLNPEDKSAIIAELPKEKKYLGENSLRVIRGDDKTLRVFDADGNFVNYVTKAGTNVKANQPLGQKARTHSMGQTNKEKLNW